VKIDPQETWAGGIVHCEFAVAATSLRDSTDDNLGI
jgi:hypothetical protein